MNAPQRQPPRVLVVDDDDRLVGAISDVLDDHGYQSAGARDGHAAIQKLGAGYSPDVIVLDVEMPHMDGCEFLEWIRQNGFDTPVVLATLADECNAEELGAVVKLSKPFTIEQLLDAIAIASNVKRTRR